MKEKIGAHVLLIIKYRIHTKTKGASVPIKQKAKHIYLYLIQAVEGRGGKGRC